MVNIKNISDDDKVILKKKYNISINELCYNLNDEFI